MNRRDAILRMGGAGAALFLGACAKADRILGVNSLQDDAPGRPANMVRSHTIFITVEDTSIQVVPETLKMRKRDQVRFKATNGRGFSIVFDDKTPFENHRLPFAKAVSTLHPLTKGRFKYTIVSDENPQLQLDPEIIVGDPPTNPRP
jgi:hypothetical protein